MTRLEKDKWTRAALCWLFAALFLAAAAGKIQDPLAFADSIAAYGLVTWKPGVTLLALSLPLFEILLALLLISGVWRRTAVLGTGLLTVLFTGALLSAMVRGLEIDCGCFGGKSILNLPPGWSVARNGVILALCGWLYASLLSCRNRRAE